MSGMDRTVTRSVYLAVLDKTLSSPLAPESDEDKDKPEGDDPPRRRPAEKPGPTKVDLDGIGQRVLALPLPARNYVGLQAGKAGILFILERPAGPASGPPQGPGGGGGGVTVQKFDLTTRKAEPVLSGVAAFELAANGEKALYRQGDK